MEIDLHLTKDSVFISNSANDRYYATGFTGSEGWLVVGQNTFLLIDSRYFIQAEQEAYPHIQIVRVVGRFNEEIAKLLLENKISYIYFDPRDLTVFTLGWLRKNFTGIKFRKIRFGLAELRSQKKTKEINFLRKAQDITDLAFTHLLSNLRSGQTEREVAWELEKFIRENNGQVAWAPFIVATGTNSAKPHHAPTDRKVAKKDMVQVDLGASYQGYCSDMSRVVFLGNPSSEQAKIYNLVSNAQDLGISNVKANVKAAFVDNQVRDFLKNTNGIYLHGLGHGVGLEIHEKPSLHFQSKDILKENMVVTVEPGIYREGYGGVRLEDEVLVTNNGSINLTKSVKSLSGVIV